MSPAFFEAQPTLFTAEADGLLPALEGPSGLVATAGAARGRFRRTLETLALAVARIEAYTPTERIEDCYRLAEEIDTARALLVQCSNAHWWARVGSRHAGGHAAVYLMSRGRGARMIRWLLDQDEIPPLPVPTRNPAPRAA